MKEVLEKKLIEGNKTYDLESERHKWVMTSGMPG